MPILSDQMENKPIRALLWGVTGFGKTVLWGQMAKHKEFTPIYCLDFDLRVDSLRAVLSHEDISKIYFDPYRDVRVQGESFVQAQMVSNNPDSIDQKYGVKFKTIVADSGSFMMRAIMSRVLYLDGGKVATTTPQLQHYMQQMSLTEEFVSKLCGSGRNFIFTCHEKNLKDEIRGILHKAVDLTGDKTPDRIPGYFNEVWHCEIVQKPGVDPQFVVRTRSDIIYSARTSFGFLQSVEKQEEIWEKIANHIRGITPKKV